MLECAKLSVHNMCTREENMISKVNFAKLTLEKFKNYFLG